MTLVLAQGCAASGVLLASRGGAALARLPHASWLQPLAFFSGEASVFWCGKAVGAPLLKSSNSVRLQPCDPPSLVYQLCFPARASRPNQLGEPLL